MSASNLVSVDLQSISNTSALKDNTRKPSGENEDEYETESMRQYQLAFDTGIDQSHSSSPSHEAAIKLKSNKDSTSSLLQLHGQTQLGVNNNKSRLKSIEEPSPPPPPTTSSYCHSDDSDENLSMMSADTLAAATVKGTTESSVVYSPEDSPRSKLPPAVSASSSATNNFSSSSSSQTTTPFITRFLSQHNGSNMSYKSTGPQSSSSHMTANGGGGSGGPDHNNRGQHHTQSDSSVDSTSTTSSSSRQLPSRHLNQHDHNHQRRHQHQLPLHPVSHGHQRTTSDNEDDVEASMLHSFDQHDTFLNIHTLVDGLTNDQRVTSATAAAETSPKPIVIQPALLFLHKFISSLRTKVNDSDSLVFQHFNQESKRFTVLFYFLYKL